MSDLLKRAQRGDSDAFGVLFRQHADALWRAAMAVLHNEEDASDALQETAVKAWRAIPRFEGRSDVGTWLTRILLHTCFDMRGKQHVEAPLDAEAEAVAGCGRDGASEWDAGSRSNEAMDVRAALARLAAGDRLVLALFYGNDLPLREVAAVLGVAEGTARVRLFRARARFKDAYAGKTSEAEGEEER